MIKGARFILACFLGCATFGAHASNTQPLQATDSFKSLSEQVLVWGKPTNTLVVMDNDDTLTMIACPNAKDPNNCQYLGGAAWYSWQSDLIKVDDPMRIANNSADLIEASDLLFALNTMVYTKDDVPTVLRSLAEMGAHLMVETARGNQTISATEDQFTELHVAPASNLLSHIDKYAPKFAGLSSLASPYRSCDSGSKRSISYRAGVMYLAGQDKGKNLVCFLQQYNQGKAADQLLSHVVFIDDTLENVQSVHEAFASQDEYTLAAYHYTALAAHKKALTHGDMASRYQAKATERWCNIISGMTTNFLLPSYSHPCS
ncbi:DUF2608 domain-containing protein [Pseudoalteromonas pernae]|uniref:DUF2608 domain-containing protein n=1 Tax=Pseudoalteromonas pernae TaxID=3118054 RepID=UPI003242D6CE